MADGTPARHRVVIIGGGFGGLACAQAFRKVPADVTLIDRRNFHLFQPLLYQVATGALSPANIAAPLRSILKRQKNVRTLMATVTGFDLTARRVLVADGPPVPFDTLVLAAGSTHHYFGKDAEWEPLATGLKTIEDATEIRRNLLSAFEKAEKETDPEARKRLLTFVVVGGGPTGVEMAGSIAELARQTLRRDFRAIDPANAHVILVENGDRVLQTFHPKLSANGLKSLRAIGVDPWLNCKVTDVKPDRVSIDRGGGTVQVVPCETVVWAAGVKASPLGGKLKEAFGDTLETDRAGRVVTGPDCSAGGRADVFVIGDLAMHAGADGKPLPGVAPVAMQQGEYVARLIDARLRGTAPPTAFKYHDKGSMATIGRSHAVAETGWMKLTGWLAWMAWLFIHLITLARFENRILVLIQWGWNYVTRNRTARLITDAMKLDRPAVEHTNPPGSIK
jgi:NADH dehydrogenase